MFRHNLMPTEHFAVARLGDSYSLQVPEMLQELLEESRLDSGAHNGQAILA